MRPRKRIHWVQPAAGTWTSGLKVTKNHGKSGFKNEESKGIKKVGKTSG
jgi:hypothetical protein